MKSLILVIGLSVSTAASAAMSMDTAQNELKSLLQARTVDELDRHESSAQSDRWLQAACESELKTHLLPRSCFRERLPSAQLSRLTRVCIENAKVSSSRLDLGGSLQDLPVECRRAATERLQDLRYIDQVDHPEQSAGRTPGSEFELISSK